MFFIAMMTGICRTLAQPCVLFLSSLFLLMASIILCSSFSSCVTACAFAKLSTAMAKNTFSNVSELITVKKKRLFQRLETPAVTKLYAFSTDNR